MHVLYGKPKLSESRSRASIVTVDVYDILGRWTDYPESAATSSG